MQLLRAGETEWAHALAGFYADREPAFLKGVCVAKGLTISEDGAPVAQFRQQELAADWKAWNEFGRADINARILPIIPVTTIQF